VIRKAVELEDLGRWTLQTIGRMASDRRLAVRRWQRMKVENGLRQPMSAESRVRDSNDLRFRQEGAHLVKQLSLRWSVANAERAEQEAAGKASGCNCVGET
jgi:hypothetical protein